jgi:hypothetical protein
MVVLWYAGLSWILLMAANWLLGAGGFGRLHLIAQIVLAAAAVVVVTTLLALAVAHTPSGPGGNTATPRVLTSLLSAEEDRLARLRTSPTARPLHDALKRLRETVQFSLPSSGPILATPEYVNFAEHVRRVCVEVSAIHADGATDSEIQVASNSVDVLQRRLQTLVRQAVR